jgi:NTP pyrophosphatase (non-canonical NTP hydrolase)
MTEHDIIYNDALNTWGHDAQMDVAIEELSELIKAIIKYRRNPSEDTAFNMADELGDVTIMMRQLEISMMRKHPDFACWRDGNMKIKLNRVRKMLSKNQP